MIVRLVAPADRWDSADGRAAVMVGQDVLVVSELAVVLLDLVGTEERSTEWLAEALVQTVGTPPEGVDPVSWVAATCDDLAKRGLLTIVSGR